MANFETQLNSRIIRGGREALQLIMSFGITLDDFRSSEGKGMFQHLLAYYNDPASSGSIPGVNAATVLFPNFELCDDPSMATEKLCEELRRNRQVLEAREVASILAEAAERDPMQALAQAASRAQALMALNASKNTDIPFDSAMVEIMFEYEQIEAGINLSKMAWPWDLLQDETGGIQEDDYIVLYGRPKSKKSWVLAYLIARAFEQCKNILVYTKEMTPKNILKRVAACLAQLPYRELRRGKLSMEEKQGLISLQEHAIAMRSATNFICLSAKDVSGGGDTIPWLRSKVEKYEPDITFVDGLYLMSDHDGRKNKAGHEKMTSISRAFREMILATKTPGVATLQANRKAAGHSNAELDEIAFSDAIGQDATIAARVIAEKTTPTIALVFGGSREFEMHGLRIGGVPAVDFTEKGPLTEKDINKAREGDSNDSEPEKKSAITKPRREPAQKKEEESKLLERQLNSLS